MWGKESEMGIATLIVFLAFLLVAAIAGFVLISSQNSSQEQTLSTAYAARREVTTQIELMDLSAIDGSDGEVDEFRYIIRLKPGAESVSLHDVVLLMNSYNDTLRLVYKEGGCTRDVTDGYYTYR